MRINVYIVRSKTKIVGCYTNYADAHIEAQGKNHYDPYERKDGSYKVETSQLDVDTSIFR